jgi:outer membrane protein OmpA-like peptidoglycan-associated protein
MKFKLSAIAAATMLLGLAACETAPKENAALTQAREAVARAESSPDVGKYSAAELDRARKLLVNAQGAAQQKGANDKITAQYAYLATQMARIAEQHAQEQAAMARVKAGEAERQQILLAARENEAQQAQAEAQSRQMAKELQDMKVSQTKRGIVLALGDVLFDTGRADLKPGAERSIEQLTSFLNEHPERKVQIEGFTDSQGPDDYNMELSQKRADAVAMAIIQRGINTQRVRAMGYGEEFPVASNKDSGSRQLNRRVEIIVSNGDQAIPGRAASGAP